MLMMKTETEPEGEAKEKEERNDKQETTKQVKRTGFRSNRLVRCAIHIN